jgi:hypothetical protein
MQYSQRYCCSSQSIVKDVVVAVGGIVEPVGNIVLVVRDVVETVGDVVEIVTDAVYSKTCHIRSTCARGASSG